MKSLSVCLACLFVAVHAAAAIGANAAGVPATATTAAAVRDADATPGTPSVDQLLARAAAALKEGRMISPKDRNVFAYYEAILQEDPGNTVAAAALRELFPYGVSAVEQAIRDGQYEQAREGIALLTKANPTNHTLTILRSKLYAAQPPVRASRSIAGRTLTFKAIGRSWINVSLASGKVVYSGILAAGEQKRFTVSQSMEVVVGNAAGVTVTVDGKPLMLHPGYRSKVARFRISASLVADQ